MFQKWDLPYKDNHKIILNKNNLEKTIRSYLCRAKQAQVRKNGGKSFVSSWEVCQHNNDDHNPKAHNRCSVLIKMTTLISEEWNIKGTYVSSRIRYNHQPQGTDGSPMAVKQCYVMEKQSTCP